MDFSVLIPVYNRDELVRRAIESCLRQTGPEFEVVLIDDGSTDGTAGVLASYQSARVRILTHERNLGVSAARTTGAAAARGEWCVWLDSDFELLPGALARLAQYCRTAPEDVANVASLCLWDDGRVTPVPTPRTERTLDYAEYLRFYAGLELTEYFNTVRRNAHAALPPPFGRAHEMSFHLALAKAFRFRIVPEILVKIHTDAAVRITAAPPRPYAAALLESASDRAIDAERILEEHGETLRAHVPAMFHDFASLAMWNHLLAGRRRAALRHMWTGSPRLARSGRAWFHLVVGLASPRALAAAKAHWQHRRNVRSRPRSSRTAPHKVVYFGGYDPEYTRSRVFIKALRRRGVEVAECVSRARVRALRLLQLAMAYARASRGASVLIVSAGGQSYVPLAKLLALATRKPLVFDAFFSYYQVHVLDTKRLGSHSLKGRYFYYLDKISASLADLVLVDTSRTVDYYVETFGLPRARFRPIPIGSDDEYFQPAVSHTTPDGPGPFVVFLVTSYFPLHGVEHVLEAARLLESTPEIRFVIVGDGYLRERMLERACSLELANTTFEAAVPPVELAAHMARADVCLGQFGATAASDMVVPAKVFDALAMAKPVVTSGTRAILDAFEDGTHLLCCPPADPTALRDAILRLYRDPRLRAKIAAQGYRRFRERYALEPIGNRLLEVLREATA
jgi:glycosyltransferase involved in cell wall biosynthesis